MITTAKSQQVEVKYGYVVQCCYRHKKQIFVVVKPCNHYGD